MLEEGNLRSLLQDNGWKFCSRIRKIIRETSQVEPCRETPSGQKIVVFGALYLKQDIRCALYLKQDIRLYVPYSQPNGWTDWAEIFCGPLGVTRG